MGHRIAFLLQFLLLANHQMGTLQLLILELQKIHILTIALYLFFQSFQLIGSLMEGVVSFFVISQFLSIVCNDVEYAELEVLFVEHQILVLRMYIHKTFAQFFEHRQLHGGVVDKGSALACRCQFPTDDAVVGIIFDIVVIEERLHIVSREVEVGLNHASVGPLL